METNYANAAQGTFCPCSGVLYQETSVFSLCYLFSTIALKNVKPLAGYRYLSEDKLHVFSYSQLFASPMPTELKSSVSSLVTVVIVHCM